MSIYGVDIGDIESAIELNENMNIKIFQIAAKNIGAEILENRISIQKTLEEISKRNIRIVVHYSYSINIAHPWSASDWWIQQLILEIKKAAHIGAFGIVIHTGKSMRHSTSTGINNMFSSLIYVHRETADLDIKILIETPAGQGTELLTDIQDFAKFIKKFSMAEDINNRFGICIDTCHVYAAGNDISTLKGIEHLFKTISDEVGLQKIKLIHLNNSKGELGSRVDRHARIVEGVIPIESMKIIIKFVNRLGIPMVLETPSKYILKDYEFVRDTISESK